MSHWLICGTGYSRFNLDDLARWGPNHLWQKYIRRHDLDEASWPPGENTGLLPMTYPWCPSIGIPSFQYSTSNHPVSHELCSSRIQGPTSIQFADTGSISWQQPDRAAAVTNVSATLPFLSTSSETNHICMMELLRPLQVEPNCSLYGTSYKGPVPLPGVFDISARLQTLQHKTPPQSRGSPSFLLVIQGLTCSI